MIEKGVLADHAEKVRRQYHERFIPQAIETGAHFHAEYPDGPKFIWTTSVGLIRDHLNSRRAGEVGTGAGDRVG